MGLKRLDARVRGYRHDVLLRCVLEDLEAYVPEVNELRSLISSPDAFRALVGRLAADAVAGRPTIEVAALRQLDACVSKLPSFGGPGDVSRRQTALEGFLEAERHCRIVNKRLRHYRRNPLRLRRAVREVINMAQDRIFSVLGHPPTFDMFEHCDFGPGLTFGLRPEERHLMFKISASQTVTPLAKQLALEVIQKLFPHWGEHLASEGHKLSVVAGNRITFVPKNAKTHRTIGIEPSLNVWLQKAVDHYLKRKLRVNGLRLRDQNFSSDLIVEESGRTLGVATVDMRAASDSISREVVSWLLPKEWHDLLFSLRSPCYTLDKGSSWSTYEKFSSMGNATTFPLESLIFESLAWACCRYASCSTSRIRVYGDDIIVPPEACGILYEVCRFLGFRVNTDKSFVFGDFRETCGVDIYRNVDVRPVYVRQIPRTAPEVANLFNRFLCNRFGFTFESTLCYLHSLVDKPLYGPAYYGWTGTTRLDESPWEEWYEGRNTQCDAFFFSPPGLVPRQWSKRYQTGKWSIERWFTIRPRLRGNFTERTLYLAFLCGMEGGVPLSNEGFLRVRTETFYGLWPELDWWPSFMRFPATTQSP